MSDWLPAGESTPSQTAFSSRRSAIVEFLPEEQNAAGFCSNRSVRYLTSVFSPVGPVLEKSEEPRPSPGAGAEEAIPPPRLSENPVDAPLWGADEVMTEPRVRPVAAGAEVVLVAAVLRENGLAEAAGFPKPKPKPVEGAVEAAGVPEKQDVCKSTHWNKTP